MSWKNSEFPGCDRFPCDVRPRESEPFAELVDEIDPETRAEIEAENTRRFREYAQGIMSRKERDEQDD